VNTRAPLPLEEVRRIGEVIHTRRRRLELSQEALAVRIGISRTHVGRIEKGKMNVTVFNLIAIAQALGTTAGELLTEAGV
jgi:XRE family transcriptional regulator, regulator of sulfur utilization